MNHCAALSRARAFTLVELVASLAVLAVLMLAIGSTVLLASKAVPDTDQPMMRRVAASRALEQIASELETAVEIDALQMRDLRFDVADRDGDGNPEELRYLWSGNAGDPLRVRYNSGSERVVIEDVQALSLDVATAEVTAGEAPLIEGPEETVFESNMFNTSFGSSASLDAGVRVAEAFRPSMGSAVAWRPTRAAVYVAPVSPASASLRVVLRAAEGGGSPSNLELAATSIDESDLSSSSWYNVSLNSDFDLSTNERYFIGVEHESGSTAGRASRGSLGQLAHYVDTGGGWSLDSSKALWVYVYGRPLIPDPDFDASTIDVVERVTLSLQVGDADAMTARTAVTLLNQPESP
jgi:prepilin-type N-terminal cleavage/methylation domain-containing protein